jgi:GcrA cell cycle regulator
MTEQANPWTPERIDRLTALWTSGATSYACAAELGVSRSTICGKIRRLGLLRCDQPFQETPAPRLMSLPASGAAAAVLSLRTGRCKWPIGHPTDATFRFCCERVWGQGQPYCSVHHAIGTVVATATHRRAA